MSFFLKYKVNILQSKKQNIKDKPIKRKGEKNTCLQNWPIQWLQMKIAINGTRLIHN